ncbi:hypothetical protein ACFRQM_47560 [Streptomyces sp. NPDC056831]|uniref:hypothetical protein n=1 Tax=Streptomyces sp. NPDC056831 TaxID=3345954 RepID=UPI0036C4A8C8
MSDAVAVVAVFSERLPLIGAHDHQPRAEVRHLHRDRIFVGVVALPYEPQSTPELPVRWVDRDELEVLDARTDTKFPALTSSTSSTRPCGSMPRLRRTRS